MIGHKETTIKNDRAILKNLATYDIINHLFFLITIIVILLKTTTNSSGILTQMGCQNVFTNGIEHKRAVWITINITFLYFI